MGISTHLDSNDIAYHMLYHSDIAERLLRRILMKKKIEGRYAVLFLTTGHLIMTSLETIRYSLPPLQG